MAEVIWSNFALEELEAIAGFIALDKPRAAERLIARVLDRVEQLSVFPHSGGKPRELSGTRYRQLVVTPVRIFYRVEGSRVLVVHVMRGERQLRRRDLPR